MSDSISITIEYEKVEITILQPDFIQVNLLEPIILGGVTAQEIGDVIAAADEKATPIGADSLGLSDSEDGNILKKWTISNLLTFLVTNLTSLFNSIYAILSSIQAHGLIDTSETFSSATKSEHTASADSEADITLALTTTRPDMFISINVTTICTLNLVGVGITYIFPTGQTANLTNLAVGIWDIIPKTIDNGATVVVRVQQVT